MSNEQFEDINICRGIAILLVLLGHSIIVFPVDLHQTAWCLRLHDVIYSFHMPIFFLISGFLFSNSSKKSFSQALKAKATKLLVPYITYTLIFLALRFLLPSMINDNKSLEESLYTIMLKGGELWFVYVLFFVFIIWSPILNKVTFKKSILLLSVIYILFLMGVHLPDDIFLLSSIVYYSVYFIIGYAIGYKIREVIQNSYVFIVLSVVFIVFNVFFINQLAEVSHYLFLMPLIGSLLCWALSIRLIKNNLVKINIGGYLSFFGNYSLQYYLFNGFALVLSRILIIKILGVSIPLLIVVGIFFLCVALETIAILICRRFKFTSFIFGISRVKDMRPIIDLQLNEK